MSLEQSSSIQPAPGEVQLPQTFDAPSAKGNLRLARTQRRIEQGREQRFLESKHRRAIPMELEAKNRIRKNVLLRRLQQRKLRLRVAETLQPTVVQRTIGPNSRMPTIQRGPDTSEIVTSIESISGFLHRGQIQPDLQQDLRQRRSVQRYQRKAARDFRAQQIPEKKVFRQHARQRRGQLRRRLTQSFRGQTPRHSCEVQWIREHRNDHQSEQSVVYQQQR